MARDPSQGERDRNCPSNQLLTATVPTPNLFTLRYQLGRNLQPYKREQVRQIPKDRTGVYAIWLPAGIHGFNDCIYVGMSEACLRSRLLSHLINETNPELRRQLRIFRDVVRFSYAYTQGRRETLDLEAAVTKQWQPKTNRTNL